MKRNHVDISDDDLDTLFRSTLKRELDVPAPAVAPIKRQTSYQPIDPPRRRLLGGGPGGVPYSGFYMVFYVMNSSRPAWGHIPA
jgi:hypothetical protein